MHLLSFELPLGLEQSRLGHTLAHGDRLVATLLLDGELLEHHLGGEGESISAGSANLPLLQVDERLEEEQHDLLGQAVLLEGGDARERHGGLDLPVAELHELQLSGGLRLLVLPSRFLTVVDQTLSQRLPLGVLLQVAATLGLHGAPRGVVVFGRDALGLVLGHF